MYFEYPGGKLYYKSLGEGVPLLILHGFGVDYTIMEAALEPVFSVLKQSRHRIYVDLPGMGRSDPLPPDQYADDVCALLGRFMDEVYPEMSFGIISHSYGGYLTRALIYNKPEKILGSFFIAPVIYPMKDDRTLPDKEKRRADSSLREKYPDHYDVFSDSAVVESEYAIKMYLQTIYPVLAGLKRENLLFYQKKGYSCSVNINHLKTPFDKPCVFLLGRQDHIVGTGDSLKIQNSYPRADFILMDDAGHNLFFEQKDFFDFLLIRWLDRLASDNRD